MKAVPVHRALQLRVLRKVGGGGAEDVALGRQHAGRRGRALVRGRHEGRQARVAGQPRHEQGDGSGLLVRLGERSIGSDVSHEQAQRDDEREDHR